MRFCLMMLLTLRRYHIYTFYVVIGVAARASDSIWLCVCVCVVYVFASC